MKPKPEPAASSKSSKKPEKPDGLAVLRDKFKDQWLAKEEAYVRRHLKDEDWNLNETARAIGCAVSSLQRALERHPELEAERQKWAEAHGWVRRRAERVHVRERAA